MIKCRVSPKFFSKKSKKLYIRFADGTIKMDVETLSMADFLSKNRKDQK